jgi:hypothetical protein
MPGYLHTEDNLEYSFFPVKNFRQVLSVKAPNDAHIALTPSASDTAPIIEIFLGGWGNKKSAIRLNKEKPDKAEAETPDVVNGETESTFVLEWNNAGKLTVSLLGATEPFLSWTNDAPFAITHLGLRTAWGATGDWKIDGTKEVHTEDSMEYTYLPAHGGNLELEVRARNDAHIALSTVPANELPLYEIFLGGWGNKKCAIRLNKEKPDVAEADVDNVVNGQEFKKFSVNWSYAGIKVNVGGDEAPMLAWTNPEPSPVLFFGVRTGHGSDGYWRIDGVEGTVEEVPVAEAEPAESNEVAATEEGEPREKREVPSVDGVSWAEGTAGSIPEGALVGGNDNGEDLYVIRVEHEGATIPGKLLPAHGVAYIPWGGEEHSKDTYEVLVVPADSVSWAAASGDAVPDNAIPGGVSLEGETLYIGRTTHEGAVTVGKVHPSHGVLYISYGGKEIGFPDYEILTKN